MGVKLTLRMDEKLIHHAKTYARKSGKSVSRLVADYFGALGATSVEKRSFQMTPTVKSLRGAFRGSDVGIDDYHRHIEEKFL